MERVDLELVPKEFIEGISCEDVSIDEMDEMLKLGEKMISFCVESKGLGLAAPQVGVNKKMFVWMNSSNTFQIVVNPQFFPDKKTTNVVESCLSYPNEQYFIKRFKTGNCRFEILTPGSKTFKKVFKKLTGERAFIWQHELDHLSGKTVSTEGVLFSAGTTESD